MDASAACGIGLTCSKDEHSRGNEERRSEPSGDGRVTRRFSSSHQPLASKAALLGVAGEGLVLANVGLGAWRLRIFH